MGIVFLSSKAKNLGVRPFTEFILSEVEGFRVTLLTCQSCEVWFRVDRRAALDREESVDSVSTHGARWFMFLPLHLLFLFFLCFGIAGELPGGTALAGRAEIPALAELSAESPSPLSSLPTCRLAQKGLTKRRIDARPLSFLGAGKIFFQQQAPHEPFAALAPLANTQTVPRYLSLQVYRL